MNNRKESQELKNQELPLCACGCGNYTKRSKLSPYNWNKYLNGHNKQNLGKKFPKEWCKNISNGRKGFRLQKKQK